MVELDCRIGCHQREILLLTKIFLSYRIADSAYAVREMSKRMAERLGRDNVFRDDDSMNLGMSYAPRIRRALKECDVLVVVIGPHFLDQLDEHGNRRIDDDSDWVRYEIRTAYERDTPVVPVLLDETPLPAVDELPDDIARVGRSQFWRIRHRTMDSDLAALIDRLAPSSRPAAGAASEVPQRIQVNTAEDHSNVITNNGGTQNITLDRGYRGGR